MCNIHTCYIYIDTHTQGQIGRYIYRTRTYHIYHPVAPYGGGACIGRLENGELTFVVDSAHLSISVASSCARIDKHGGVHHVPFVVVACFVIRSRYENMVCCSSVVRQT